MLNLENHMKCFALKAATSLVYGLYLLIHSVETFLHWVVCALIDSLFRILSIFVPSLQYILLTTPVPETTVFMRSWRFAFRCHISSCQLIFVKFSFFFIEVDLRFVFSLVQFDYSWLTVVSYHVAFCRNFIRNGCLII